MGTIELLFYFIAMGVFFFGYTGLIAIKYGIQPSVSESYYKLPRNWQWLFTIATFGYAILAMIIGLDLTGNGLVFLAGAAIGFVGSAPAFHDLGLERTVHMVGAFVGILSAQAFISIILGFWWITLGLVVLSAIFYCFKKTRVNIIWWVEIVSFVSIYLSYFILLF